MWGFLLGGGVCEEVCADLMALEGGMVKRWESDRANGVSRKSGCAVGLVCGPDCGDGI